MKLKTRQWLTLDRIVIMTSMISSLTSLTVTILIMIIFVSDTAWSNIIFDVKEWILNQQWDASVRKSYQSSGSSYNHKFRQIHMCRVYEYLKTNYDLQDQVFLATSR